jgi:hypothetical protein
VIDRSQNARHSVSPSGLLCKGRLPVWNSRCGTHLGSGHVRPRQQAGHMIASDPVARCSISCKPGAVHIWDAALAGVTRPKPVPVQRAPRRPVIVPAGRIPGAARERSANPPAGTALAPSSGLPPEGVPIERDWPCVTELRTDVKHVTKQETALSSSLPGLTRLDPAIHAASAGARRPRASGPSQSKPIERIAEEAAQK